MDPVTSTLNKTRRAAGRVQTIVVLTVAMSVIAGLTWFVSGGFDDGFTAVEVAPNGAAARDLKAGRVNT